MILKDKEIVESKSAIIQAGQKQELDVAFYLRRAFKDAKNVFVFNDFKFSYNGETAQIDHLILYPFGFVLIESKSIKGEVKVNKIGEWSRSYKGKWQGMSSPLKQVELQQKLLKEFLHENRERILPKFLFNLKQQSFGGRCWNNLCAISSEVIIDRDSMPAKLSKALVKSEFLVDKVIEVMDLKNIVLRTLDLRDARPDFRPNELKSICDFLLNQCDSISVKEIDEKAPDLEMKPSYQVSCKSCGSTDSLEARSGRYGYYVVCPQCNTNTALKRNCLSCGDKETKVSKRKSSFTLFCAKCRISTPMNL